MWFSKLNDVVELLRCLNDVDEVAAQTSILQHLEWVIPHIELSTFVTEESKQSVRTAHSNVKMSVQQFGGSINQVKEILETLIEHLGKDYFTSSFESLNCKSRTHIHPEIILSKKLEISDETANIIMIRIGNRSYWHYPGMIIRPGREGWIEHMVSLDPLYVVDESLSLLHPVTQKFNEMYQARLRKIVVDPQQPNELLAAIPNNQIGYCLIYNFFNYIPFEEITQYLQEIYIKLRPGGVVAITINDCDQPGAVLLAETLYSSYCPGALIKDKICGMGYQILHELKLNTTALWLELGKPGELTSMRGGQALAKVLPIMT